MTKDERLIIEAYQEMCQAMISKDAAVLNKVLDDSFMLAHMTGMRQSQKAFIHAYEKWPSGYKTNLPDGGYQYIQYSILSGMEKGGQRASSRRCGGNYAGGKALAWCSTP